ncbi:MAG: FAD-dependent oxidoreductase [Microbacteriaceae bacterium]
MTQSQTFVIVGAGLAGAKAAQTLREEGFDGRVVLVAAESDAPYLRPPLSKEYLTGSAERDSIFVNPAQWYDEHNIELRLGSPATGLNTAAHEVTLGNGETLKYDKLLLATGAGSRHLGGPGDQLAGVHYLRTVAESEALRSDLSAGGRRIVIVGAGWIGLEIASAARGYGNSVTVLGMEEVPLNVALGDELGAVFGELHRENDVNLRMSTSVSEIVGADGKVTGVRLPSGETIPAEVVVVGIGAIPNTELADKAGLEVKNGIVVDESLRSSDPDVYAAGDVANWYHPVLKERMRVEHWANAEHSGPAAAKAMLGQTVSYDDLPYFYTDQFDLGMEYSGYGSRTKNATVVYRGDKAKREFVAFWVLDGRVVAGINVNVWDVNEAVQKLIRSGARVDAAKLADQNVPLEELAAAADSEGQRAGSVAGGE